MRSFKVPRTIKRCRPPEKGPSKPKSLSFRTRLRQDIFLGTADELTAIEPDLETRDVFLVSHLEEEPIFEDLTKFFTTVFEFFAIRPNAAKARDLTEVGTVFQELVTGAAKFLLDEFA